MFTQFQDLWNQRWDKHRHTSSDRWQAMQSFVDQHVPRPAQDMPYAPIDIDLWKRELRRKRSNTAVGPDGISKQDLQRLPDAVTHQLLSIFDRIENGGEWPKEMLTGLITAIEKSPHATKPSQFRPICVLSMAYRTWSSIRTKQILSWLALLAPDGLIGNRARKETAHIWWTISGLIERSWYSETPLCGGIGDIVKCYNCLPRVPVFHIARHLGIPVQILRPGAQAITGLERRFVITGGAGPALRSTTGFPEGDPLSVTAMFMVNIVLFDWVRIHEPNVRLWTFVDNLEATTEHPETVRSGIQCIQAFCEEMDIELDAGKTVYWATNAAARHTLREAGLPVIFDTKDLGGQMVFCRRHTNRVLRERAASLVDYWPRLMRSPAPQAQKEISLRVAAWPKAFFGISTTIFGADHVARLRTRALRSLGWSNKGMHPMLQLSCICDVRSDPGYWCVWQTIWTFRRFADPEPASEVLDFLVSNPDRRIDPGPCGIFLQRLHSIAWSWQGQGWIQDHQGHFIHIFAAPSKLLQTRVRHAWHSYVCATAAERTSMQGIQTADVDFTVKALKPLDTQQQGYVRYALNGSFYTRDKLIHAGVVDSTTCPWCSAEDSVVHRHWHCPATAHLRTHVTEELRTQIFSMPNCVIQHGWIPAPSHLDQFQQQLCQIPDLTTTFLTVESRLPVAHLFTDGSGLCPATPHLRVATWGVVVANLPDDTFTTVAQGGVPGLLQTILRSEILAAIAALEWVLAHRHPAILWVDNEHVQRNLENFRRSAPDLTQFQNDEDLWSRLAFLCRQATALDLLVRAVKVTAHADHTQFSDPIEKWALKGNTAADQAAAAARSLLPSSFWACWFALQKEYDQLTIIRDAVHQLFIKVGQWAQMHSTRTDSTPATTAPTARDEDTHPCLFAPFPDWDSRDSNVQLGTCGSVVFQWLRDQLCHCHAPAQWISTYQLVVHFQRATKLIGPICIRKQWMPGEEAPLHMRYSLCQQATWLSHYIVRLARAFGIVVTPVRRRPAGNSFPIWTGCFRLHVPVETVEGMDLIFARYVGKPIRHVGKDLGEVPILTQDG